MGRLFLILTLLPILQACTHENYPCYDITRVVTEIGVRNRTEEFMKQDFNSMSDSGLEDWMEKFDSGKSWDDGSLSSNIWKMTALRNCGLEWRAETGRAYQDQLDSLVSNHKAMLDRRKDREEAKRVAAEAYERSVLEDKCSRASANAERRLKKKFTCDFDIHDLIRSIIHRDISEDEARKIVTARFQNRPSFYALQATRDFALFVIRPEFSGYATYQKEFGVTIMVRGSGFFQDQELSEASRFWEFVGVTYYQSHLGQRQAFEFRAAPDLTKDN